MRTACLLSLVTLLLARGVAAAEVSGHVALMSDYRYRGESLSGGRPAVQAGGSYDHPSGLFLGALASTVRTDPATSGIGAQLYGGYAQTFGANASWDLGFASYLFPHPLVEPSYDYTEMFFGISCDVVSARLYYSNDYFGGSGRALYLEVNGFRQFDERIALIGHLGYLDLSQLRQPMAGRKGGSLSDFKAGVAIDVARFTLEFSVVGTTAQSDTCPAGTGHCNATGVISISRSF